jgi:aryl-alcohol dehydrogenase-like predicted oxidoreductase
LFDPTQYTKELQLACHDLNIQLRVSCALAGGLLTNKYAGIRYQPPPWNLLPIERNYLYSTVTPWAKKHDNVGDRWKAYQEHMMDTLSDIALKHRVSVTSVSLRWVMQLEHVATVVVPICKDNDEPERLRQVFRFELDEDDLDRLWKATGEAELVKEPEINPVVGIEEVDFEGVEHADSDSLFLPDLSRNKLWL